jgi:hypothetical protein
MGTPGERSGTWELKYGKKASAAAIGTRDGSGLRREKTDHLAATAAAPSVGLNFLGLGVTQRGARWNHTPIFRGRYSGCVYVSLEGRRWYLRKVSSTNNMQLCR